MQANKPNAVRERRVSFLLLFCSLLAFAQPAYALLLDQESGFITGFTQFNELPRAQIFTVGLPGQLEAIEVFVSQLRVPPAT